MLFEAMLHFIKGQGLLIREGDIEDLRDEFNYWGVRYE
jgi:hypothetical protein